MENDGNFEISEDNFFPCADYKLLKRKTKKGVQTVKSKARYFSALFYVNENFEYIESYDPIVPYFPANSNLVLKSPPQLEVIDSDISIIASRRYPPYVKNLYKVLNPNSKQFGGTSHSDENIYGELTVGTLHKLIELMKQHCGLKHDSAFLDIGSGLGKPNFHVAQLVDPIINVGVERSKPRFIVRSFFLQRLPFYIFYLF
jgi:hypothetical protein